MSTIQFLVLLAAFILLALGISVEVGTQLGKSLGQLLGDVFARRKGK